MRGSRSCAMRSPNWLLAAHCASECCGCQSTVSAENAARSLSVVVRLRVRSQASAALQSTGVRGCSSRTRAFCLRRTRRIVANAEQGRPERRESESISSRVAGEQRSTTGRSGTRAATHAQWPVPTPTPQAATDACDLGRRRTACDLARSRRCAAWRTDRRPSAFRHASLAVHSRRNARETSGSSRMIASVGPRRSRVAARRVRSPPGAAGSRAASRHGARRSPVERKPA